MYGSVANPGFFVGRGIEFQPEISIFNYKPPDQCKTIPVAGSDWMKKNKLILGIIGALMMIVCTFFLAFYAIRDYYLSKNGMRVAGKVIDNASVCKRWNKYVGVEYGGEIHKVNIYGPDCRSAEFSINQVIQLRSNKSGSLLVLESNHYIFRVCFMLLIFILSVFVNALMYNQYKFWKRSTRASGNQQQQLV